MKITEIKTYYVPLGYDEPFVPAWSSEKKRRLGVTVVKILTDEGITGIGGTHSHAGSFAHPDEREFDDYTQVLTVVFGEPGGRFFYFYLSAGLSPLPKPLLFSPNT